MTRTVLKSALLAAVACFGLQAETLKANIPFDFQIGSKKLPAGEYLVNESSRLVMLRNTTGGGAASLTLPTSSKAATAEPRLVFQRYGDQHFLRSVWMAGSNQGFEYPQGSQERELIARTTAVQTASVSLRRQ